LDASRTETSSRLEAAARSPVPHRGAGAVTSKQQVRSAARALQRGTRGAQGARSSDDSMLACSIVQRLSLRSWCVFARSNSIAPVCVQLVYGNELRAIRVCSPTAGVFSLFAIAETPTTLLSSDTLLSKTNPLQSGSRRHVSSVLPESRIQGSSSFVRRQRWREQQIGRSVRAEVAGRGDAASHRDELNAHFKCGPASRYIVPF